MNEYEKLLEMYLTSITSTGELKNLKMTGKPV